MDIFRVQELYAAVPEFVGEEEGDETIPQQPIFVVRDLLRSCAHLAHQVTILYVYLFLRGLLAGWGHSTHTVTHLSVHSGLGV